MGSSHGPGSVFESVPVLLEMPNSGSTSIQTSFEGTPCPAPMEFLMHREFQNGS